MQKGALMKRLRLDETGICGSWLHDCRCTRSGAEGFSDLHLSEFGTPEYCFKREEFSNTAGSEAHLVEIQEVLELAQAVALESEEENPRLSLETHSESVLRGCGTKGRP